MCGVGALPRIYNTSMDMWRRTVRPACHSIGVRCVRPRRHARATALRCWELGARRSQGALYPVVKQPGKTVQHLEFPVGILRSVSLDVCVGSAARTWVSQSGVRGSVGVCFLGVVCVYPVCARRGLSHTQTTV